VRRGRFPTCDLGVSQYLLNKALYDAVILEYDAQGHSLTIVSIPITCIEKNKRYSTTPSPKVRRGRFPTWDLGVSQYLLNKALYDVVILDYHRMAHSLTIV